MKIIIKISLIFFLFSTFSAVSASSSSELEMDSRSLTEIHLHHPGMSFSDIADHLIFAGTMNKSVIEKSIALLGYYSYFYKCKEEEAEFAAAEWNRLISHFDEFSLSYRWITTRNVDGQHAEPGAESVSLQITLTKRKTPWYWLVCR